MFCGPKTADVSRGETEKTSAVEGLQTILFP